MQTLRRVNENYKSKKEHKGELKNTFFCFDFVISSTRNSSIKMYIEVCINQLKFFGKNSEWLIVD